MEVHFETRYCLSDNGKFIADDPSYWVPIMQYFFKQSDNIAIHCWTGEEKVNEEIRHEFTELSIKHDMYMTIYEGRLAEKIIDFLTKNPQDEDGQIKWFSIFLYLNNNCHFSSEHFGTEFHANNLNVEQFEYIKSILPKDTNFTTWD
ncbi:hypothetical protein [Chungangia koreensis]